MRFTLQVKTSDAPDHRRSGSGSPRDKSSPSHGSGSLPIQGGSQPSRCLMLKRENRMWIASMTLKPPCQISAGWLSKSGSC